MLSSILIVHFSALAIWLSRGMFRRWFNPLALYSALWGVSLLAYESGLFRHVPIGREAWTSIILAWTFLFVGAAVIFFMPAKPNAQEINLRRLEAVIVLFSLLGLIGIVYLAKILTEQFGSIVAAMFVNASTIYNKRIVGDFAGLPYVGSFLYSASALAGIYTAKRARFTFVGLIPLALVIVQSFLMMARFGFAFALVLFIVGLVFTPKKQAFNRIHLLLASTLAAFAMVSGFVAMSLTRGVGADFPGQSPTMESVSEVVPIAPAIYSNLSAPPVALGRYFASRDHRDAWFGMYTFTPIYRLLGKFGLSPGEIPAYEEFYSTPIDTNTMTYLKNLHSDFGWLGLAGFPLLLGAASMLAYQRLNRPVFLATFPFLCTVIVFSFVALTTTGDWYIGLLASIAGIRTTCSSSQPAV